MKRLFRLFLVISIHSVLLSFFVHCVEAQDTRPTSIQWLTSLKSDFNINGSVDFADFVAFIDHFGSRNGDTNFDSRFDLSQNSTVDFTDFLEFVSDFGKAQIILDVQLLPMFDTPAGLQVKYPNSPNVTYSISATGNETARTTNDTTVVDFNGGVQGEGFDIEIIGTDSEAEQVTGNKSTIKLPIFYANALLSETPKNDDNRFVFNLNIQVMPDTLWAYVETEDRDDIEFNLSDSASLIAGRTFDIQDQYEQHRLYKIDRTQWVTPEIRTILFRERIGKVYRIVFSNFGGFRLKRK